MTGQAAMDMDCVGDVIDVLSEKEEAVLSALRAIVTDVRGRDRLPGVEAFDRALVDAGALRLSGDGENASRLFRFCEARFSLGVGPTPGEGIQIEFIPEER